MFLKRLHLRNFRNYKEAVVEFSPHINCILGANAQGKSNILEAIYLLIFGSSFRTKRYLDIIREGESHCSIEIFFEKYGVRQSLKINFRGKERRVDYNTTELGSLRQVFGILFGVLLTPKDSFLIDGPPQLRRDYIDMQLAQIDPLYLHHMTRYFRAMKQRNALLRIKQQLGIECWEHEMARSAAYITKERFFALKELKELAQNLHEGLCNDRLDLTFELPPEDLEKHYLQTYIKQRAREFFMGYTLSGPHRDDFNLLVDGKEARLFASEGQKRSLAATLRLASWSLLFEESDLKPLLCIDDFGLSLDQNRKKDLLAHLNCLGQVFITSAEERSAFSLPDTTKFFNVSSGTILPG